MIVKYTYFCGYHSSYDKIYQKLSSCGYFILWQTYNTQLSMMKKMLNFKWWSISVDTSKHLAVNSCNMYMYSVHSLSLIGNRSGCESVCSKVENNRFCTPPHQSSYSALSLLLFSRSLLFCFLFCHKHHKIYPLKLFLCISQKFYHFCHFSKYEHTFKHLLM